LLGLFATVLNLAAVVLFVAGYRARTRQRLRRVERWALACLATMLVGSALFVASFFAVFFDGLRANPLAAALTVGLPALLPLLSWSGLVLMRRRASAPT